MPPVIGCEVFVALNPTGPVNIVFTLNGMSASELNCMCTVQFTDPFGCMEVGLVADNITEVGAGTAIKIIIILNFTCTNLFMSTQF